MGAGRFAVNSGHSRAGLYQIEAELAATMTPNYNGGYSINTPGQRPSTMTPNSAGGYTINTPGQGPTTLTPNSGGGYRQSLWRAVTLAPHAARRPQRQLVLAVAAAASLARRGRDSGGKLRVRGLVCRSLARSADELCPC